MPQCNTSTNQQQQNVLAFGVLWCLGRYFKLTLAESDREQWQGGPTVLKFMADSNGRSKKAGNVLHSLIAIKGHGNVTPQKRVLGGQSTQ